MSISHYWVSGIQVAGLIVGLYGFFFLSIGVFGVKSIPWFRALLPATGAALGSILIYLSFLGLRPDDTIVSSPLSLVSLYPLLARLSLKMAQ